MVARRASSGMVICALQMMTMVVCGASLSAQQSARIIGSVREEGTERVLQGVSVRLQPGGRLAVTDAAGRFELRSLTPGDYTLTVAFLGHQDVSVAVRLGSAESEEVELALPAAAILLDEVQVTALRGARAVRDVPAPVSVVDRARLEERGSPKVGAVFALEPGVEVEGDGPFLGMPVIRGLSGNRVLVLVDGQRLNNSREAINFGGVQPSLVDVDRIQEVEILRGPASVLYGTDALGGIVNIVTTRPAFTSEGLDAGFRLRSGYSTVDAGRDVTGEARVAGRTTALRMSATWRAADNFRSPEGEVLNSAARSLDLGADLLWGPADGHRVGVSLQRFRARDVGVPGATGVFTGSYPFTNRDKVAASYDVEAMGPLGSLHVEGYLQQQEESFATILDLPPVSAGPFRLLIDSESNRVSDVRTLGVGAQLARGLGQRTRLTYGVELFRDEVDEVRRETTTTVRQPVNQGPPPTTTTRVDSFPTTPPSTFQGLGAYVQGELNTPRLSLTTGIRYDRFDIETERLARPEGELPATDDVEDAFSASLGALVRASEHVQPVLSVGRAFRTPNIIERYFFGPGSQGGLSVPNPELRDETSFNVDAGVRLHFGGLRGSVTAYQNRIDDFITFVPGTYQGLPTFAGQPVSTVGNIGEARIRGVEASADYGFTGGALALMLFGNVSGGDGEDLETGDPIFVPPVKGVLGARVGDTASRTALTVTARMVGRQDDVPEGFESTAGFTMLDAHGSLDLARWLPWDATLRLGVENVLDKSYHEPLNANLAPARNLRTSLNVSF
jgi:hemoglobin/transferrin/lactoferrin receptor protein